MSSQRKNIADQLYEIGKLPPQSVEMEEAVLGGIMLERDALPVIPFIRAEMFYKEAHILIMKGILELRDEGNPIDILTVTNKLKERSVLDLAGGAYYISQLTNRVASAANVEFHARIIQQKWIAREIIKEGGDVIKKAYEDGVDVFDLLEFWAHRATQMQMQTISGKEMEHIREVLEKEAKEFSARVEAFTAGIPVGVDTGLFDLNKNTGGWQKTDLIIIAARPAMGKTAFALGLAKAAAKSKSEKPVAIFSLEMGSVQLVQRLLVADAQISGTGYRMGNLANWEHNSLVQYRTQLMNTPIYIDDTPALSVFDFRAKARRMKQQHDIQLIIVDYVQLMTAGSEMNRYSNREQEISLITRTLKATAKELDIPIIALSQLSRETEKRGGDKRPQLSDLRESGAIEQDADIVAFIHRPEYYGFDQDAEGNSTRGMAEIIIAKHRNGPIGTIDVKWIDSLMKFADKEDPQRKISAIPRPNVDFTEPLREQTIVTDENKTIEDPF